MPGFMPAPMVFFQHQHQHQHHHAVTATAPAAVNPKAVQLQKVDQAQINMQYNNKVVPESNVPLPPFDAQRCAAAVAAAEESQQPHKGVWPYVGW
eukprot:jgi/Chlat1/1999/Chrsp158S02289